MFATSSQLHQWTFSGTTELSRLRTATNRNFIKEQGRSASDDVFLSAAEERTLLRHYEYVLKEFCGCFQPPMPKYVVGTSLAFFKRFYLHNSVMDYHPKDIYLTCVYLACKVEEFNVSIQQFVLNVPAKHRTQAEDVVLSQELFLMQQLSYHLTIHNAYRPLEGLLIDIKTRCMSIPDVERLRKGADEFIDRSLNTDVSLIFAPSQIALAALLASAAKQNLELDSYVANTLLASGTRENLLKTVEHIKRIRYMVKHQEALTRDEVRAIEVKVEACRNQENNPESVIYKQKMEDFWEEEEERRSRKRMKKVQEAHDEEDILLGP